MTRTTQWKQHALSCLLGTSLLSFQQLGLAQCPISFPSGGSPATVTITVAWAGEPTDGTQTAPAYFTDQVTVGNASVPAGSYLGWCIDDPDDIDAGPTSYPTLMFSSCDPNLNTQLEALGYSYPGTVYVTPQIWGQINYILNNQGGATFYDVQIAIWNLIGGPIAPGQLQTPPYPAWTQTEVTALLTAAQAAVPTATSTYTPACGGVIAVVVAETTGSEPPVQLTIIEVPVAPNLTPGDLGCFKCLSDAEAAALAAVTAQLGGTPPTGVTYSTSGTCPTTITVTGTACNTSFTVSFTVKILGAPTFSGLPPATVTTGTLPTVATVTAADTCGLGLPVNYSQTVTNPYNSCDEVYTRTWTASDCANQTIKFVETITVTNSYTQTICGSCSSQNCYGGSLWCNAHLTCSPGKNCIVYCRNASVKLQCKNGQTYTYPVPDCQVNFSSSCNKGTCSFQGGSWQTTVPCKGDSQVFLSGCGIPWQSQFANCTSFSWTGTFCCSQPGVNCQWQCGACGYNCNLNNCSSIQVKPCYQNQCSFNNNDCAGTPENFKNYCQNGNGNNNGGNQGGNSYCGSWGNSGGFSWH